MKLQTPAVFALGAAGYAALELLWRGRTHWTMALTGGTVLVGLRQLRRRVHEESPLSRCLCGAACITAAEYVVGCTVNRHFRSNTIWKTSGISTFIRSVGIGIKKLNLFMCKAAKHTAVSEKIVFLCQQATAYLSIRKYYINLQQSTPP